MTTYGSGLALDESWDFRVNANTGDLDFEQEAQELQKDLAFGVARLLDGEVGDVLEAGELADIRLEVRDVIESDPRIDEVTDIEAATEDRQSMLVIEVTAQVVTPDDAESIEQIFDIEIDTS